MKRWLFTFVAVLVPLWAHADTVTITSGTFTQTNLGSGVLAATGDQFDLTSTMEVGISALFNCFPCIPGDALSLDTFAVGPGHGSGTVDGVSYSSLRIDGNLNFDAPSVTVPDIPMGTPFGTAFDITLPFAMSGHLSGTTVPDTPPEFTKDLVGQGDVTVQLISGPITPNLSGYVARSAVWTFGQPQAVPEPATMALLIGGGAMLIRSRRRPKRSSGRTT